MRPEIYEFEDCLFRFPLPFTTHVGDRDEKKLIYLTETRLVIKKITIAFERDDAPRNMKITRNRKSLRKHGSQAMKRLYCPRLPETDSLLGSYGRLRHCGIPGLFGHKWSWLDRSTMWAFAQNASRSNNIYHFCPDSKIHQNNDKHLNESRSRENFRVQRVTCFRGRATYN